MLWNSVDLKNSSKEEPVEEVPRIVPRICGICDVQHHLAAAKAVDQCFGLEANEILPTAYRMREINELGIIHAFTCTPFLFPSSTGLHSRKG